MIHFGLISENLINFIESNSVSGLLSVRQLSLYFD